MNQLSRIVLSGVVVFVTIACYAQPEIPHDLYFPPVTPNAVKVMTFNIRANNLVEIFDSWSGRKKLVYEVISFHTPDILGLQEPLRGQLEQLQQSFPQYACYSAGGKDGKTKGESCPIFYRKDRFNLIGAGTFWFSNRPDTPGSQGWGEPVPRFCSWVQLAEKGQTAGFYVYNTHLAWMSQRSRNKSVRLLAHQIAARNSSLPFIIIGDFNMRRINPAMEFLRTGSDENKFPVTDAWLSVHPDNPDTSTCNFGKWSTGPQIDYIQLGQNTKAVEVEIDSRKIDGRYPSDHFPVIAKIVFPDPPAQPLPAAIAVDNAKLTTQNSKL